MDLIQTKHDPHGVQRLLEILRRQQDPNVPNPTSSPATSALPATVPAISTPPYATNPFSASASYTPGEASTSAVDSDSDAANRRHAYNTTQTKYSVPTPSEPFDPYAFNPFSSTNPVLTHPTPTPAPSIAKPAVRDLASLSFADSLPILSTLSTDAALLRRLRTLRTQQHELEKKLAKEYHAFTATANKQFPNPRLRAREDAQRREDLLKQWDECVTNQQIELERAGVPGVKVSRDRRETDKQKKILGVLADMLDEEDT